MAKLSDYQAQFPKPDLANFDPQSWTDLGNGVLGIFFDSAVGLAKKLVDETKDFLTKMAKKEWFLQTGLKDGDIDREDYAMIRADSVRAIRNFLIFKQVVVAKAVDAFMEALLKMFDVVIMRRIGL